MNKYLYTAVISLLILGTSVAFAVTKPAPDADLSSISYVFYLYYNNGELLADRDYQIKFDLINEKFVLVSPQPGMYRLAIYNYKGDVMQNISFDPRKGDPNFTQGKLQVKAPYVSDGQKASFFDDQGRPLVTIFVAEASICNDDGQCNAAAGETQTTCALDCSVAGTPRVSATPAPVFDEGPDMTMILIYVVGGVGVLVGAWFGWKWWKKKQEDSFLPPPPAMTPPAPPPVNPQ